MKHLLLDLAMNGITIRITDGDFAMKEAVILTLEKTHPTTSVKWYRERVESYGMCDAHFEEILSDMRYQLLSDMGLPV